MSWLSDLFKSRTMTFPNIDGRAFEKEIANKPDAILLDVRTPGEYADGRLPNAILLDYNGGEFARKLSSLDPAKSYLVYCRSGARSFNACVQMQNAGIADVVNMRGGIMGYPGKIIR